MARIMKTMSEAEKEEFLTVMEENKNSRSEKEFFQLSVDKRKTMIFDLLNARRKKMGKTPYKESLLERKYERLKKYFLETRNATLTDDSAKLSENDLLSMLYETPTLLASSLSDRVIPSIANLDNNEEIGPETTSRIIKEDGSIILSAISRTNLQIRILTDYGILKSFVDKPRNFRTSPELIYAIAELRRSEGDLEADKDVMLSRAKLEERYGLTQEDVKKLYDIGKSRYSSDEYFER